jgi:hypothetical protein
MAELENKVNWFLANGTILLLLDFFSCIYRGAASDLRPCVLRSKGPCLHQLAFARLLLSLGVKGSHGSAKEAPYG